MGTKTLEIWQKTLLAIVLEVSAVWTNPDGSTGTSEAQLEINYAPMFVCQRYTYRTPDGAVHPVPWLFGNRTRRGWYETPQGSIETCAGESGGADGIVIDGRRYSIAEDGRVR